MEKNFKLNFFKFIMKVVLKKLYIILINKFANLILVAIMAIFFKINIIVNNAFLNVRNVIIFRNANYVKKIIKIFQINANVTKIFLKIRLENAKVKKTNFCII